jgi:glycerol kinase
MAGRDVVLSIDQGTTNTKVLALDAEGRVVHRSSVPTDMCFPRPGWAESDAIAIWRSTVSAIERCLAGIGQREVSAVGISCQRETAVGWERSTGTPIGPAVSWQCLRSAPLCERLRRDGAGERVRRLSGLDLSPMFAAGKMAWLLEQIPDGVARARDGEICLGTIDSWLLWNLTGGQRHATDFTNASRTQLLDLQALRWSDDLLSIFSIPAAALPELSPSAAQFGIGTLPGGVDAPVCAMTGDSHASLVGHGVLAPGSVKATFGTGTSVLAPIRPGQRSATLSETIGWSRSTADGDEVVRALEGNIYATGAALDLAATLIGVDGDIARLHELAAADGGAARGVYFVPAFSGLGAPHWDADAAGLLVGLTRSTGRADIARAAFEAVAFQVGDVLDALPERPTDGVLHVDGGAMRSDLLVERPEEPDLSAVGAAHLAGHQIGLWPDLDALSPLRSTVATFEPAPDRDWDACRGGWVDAVRRSRGNQVTTGENA